jgi:hypothetical protein
MKIQLAEIKNKLIPQIQKLNKESTFYFILGAGFSGIMVL